MCKLWPMKSRSWSRVKTPIWLPKGLCPVWFHVPANTSCCDHEREKSDWLALQSWESEQGLNFFVHNWVQHVAFYMRNDRLREESVCAFPACVIQRHRAVFEEMCRRLWCRAFSSTFRYRHSEQVLKEQFTTKSKIHACPPTCSVVYPCWLFWCELPGSGVISWRDVCFLLRCNGTRCTVPSAQGYDWQVSSVERK